MAILNRVVCLPSDTECSILARTQGVFEIWQPQLVLGATPRELLLLNRQSHTLVRICSDYKDVHFKFECLYLKVCQQDAGDKSIGGTRIGVVTWRQAKAVLRAEWERPALNGEVPSHYEQIVQARGDISTIPPEAAACISMIGVLFLGKDKLEHGLVYLDDEFPLSLAYVDDIETIREVVSQATVVAVDELQGIRRRLSGFVTGS